MVRKQVSVLLLLLLFMALLLSTVGGCQRSTEQGLSEWTGGVKVRTLSGKVEGKVDGEDTLAWKGNTRGRRFRLGMHAVRNHRLDQR
jgi:hypothetical protein